MDKRKKKYDAFDLQKKNCSYLPIISSSYVYYYVRTEK